MNRPGCVTIVIALLVVTNRAAAAPASLTIADDVAGCPDATSLRTSIASGLGREPPDDATVRVSVRKNDDALYAEIVVERAGTPPRARVVTGDTCGDLVRASALVAVLALKQDEAPPPPPPPVDPPLAKREDAPTPSPVAPLRAASAVVIASGMTSFALLPRPASGAALAARLRVTEAVWLSARGFHLPAVQTQDEAFALGLLGGGAGGCVEPFGGVSWAVNGCAHVMAGALSVSDIATPLRDDRSQAFVGASLGAGARGRLVGPLVLEGSIESMVPFRHPTFVTATCPGTGFQQPFATLALSLGVGVSIP